MSERDTCGLRRAAVIWVGRFWLVWALIGLTTMPAAGQGSAEDYRRAAEMPGKVRGLVLNERLDATWLDDHTLVCRIEFRDDDGVGSRFERITANTGERGPAFDHAALAHSLSMILDREVDPAKLPIERLATMPGKLLAISTDPPRAVEVEPESDREIRLPVDRIAEEQSVLLALISDAMRVVSIDPETGKATPVSDPESLGVFTLPATRDTRSRGGGTDTAIAFYNRTQGPIDIAWLDHGGGSRTYATVEPGGVHRQHTFAGHLWQVTSHEGDNLGRYRGELKPGVVIVMPNFAEPEDQPEPPAPSNGSPDGRYAVELDEHNATIIERATGEAVFRTSDGHAGDAYTSKISWSPTSDRLVILREEPAQTHTVSMIDTAPDDQLQPKLVQHQYLKPGDRIAVPVPVLIDVKSGTARPVAEGLTDTAWSLSQFNWKPDGSAFWFVYNRRGHQMLRVIRVDAATGESRVVIEETSDTFIDYAQKLYMQPLFDRDELLWMSERNGRNRLYACDLDTGAGLREIETGPGIVRGVDDINEAAGTITVRMLGIDPEEDPYHVHAVRASLDGNSVTRLTAGDGTHRLEPSPDGSYMVATYSRTDLPPVHELRRASDGEPITEIVRADWSPLLESGWRPPERFVAKGRDGQTDIWGVIFKPSTFDPAKKYPVIENIYAGPHGHFVPKTFDAWHGSRAVAELGFVVVRIDGMGTNWRSKAFHDVAWKNLGDSGFPDRIAWIKSAAKARPWMDLSRIGIYGGSAGGQSALRAMLAHGDFYHAAAADCGCHDNRMDKIWWNELWMGWPIGEHYAGQSNVTNAHKLEGDLLLVVGELDRNVDPASTMQVVDALITADKDFELLVMPGVGHGAMGTPYGQRRLKDFFVRTLLGVEPRWE